MHLQFICDKPAYIIPTRLWSGCCGYISMVFHAISCCYFGLRYIFILLWGKPESKGSQSSILKFYSPFNSLINKPILHPSRFFKPSIFSQYNASFLIAMSILSFTSTKFKLFFSYPCNNFLNSCSA